MITSQQNITEQNKWYTSCLKIPDKAKSIRYVVCNYTKPPQQLSAMLNEASIVKILLGASQIAYFAIKLGILRKIATIAISQKRHFGSQFQNSENTFQYKLPPKTWEKSPQKPLSATRKWFFGHCYV